MFRHGVKPVIGLIGAIGAGKSLAARCSRARGGWVVDADALGHDALRQPGIMARVVDAAGRSCPKTRRFARSPAIGRIVFADSGERAALERIVFPIYRQAMPG